ncbi:Uma2 family endonuclease [uncultured Thiodictyon sp.]|jgi:Uma2 family endonuclease|uniref:Uma2 family endonuclease n=1 Tax=uncultured Thiodictyon sp. TaxID=1846217 RepID=UPI0025DE9DF6|nr:Uma2 family endonuclease [uncultured Thiodictyon sp.]
MSVPALQMPVLPRLPTEDDLPYEDGIPMESARHFAQLELLIQTLLPWAIARGDVAVGGNQFVYFSGEQVRGRHFRGPDIYVVTGVRRRERKSWVVWEEGKGPDVIVELLSESTAAFDKGEKRLVYQDQLRVPAYYWFDPFNPADRAGFVLRGSRYRPIMRDADGNLPVAVLGLKLVLWEGEFDGIAATWLRWADRDGLLPLPVEVASRRAAAAETRAEAEQARAETERTRAQAERERAEHAEQELARLRALLAGPGNSDPRQR